MIKSVQILGTSAGIPTIEQGVSSYIVSFSNYDIMVDCGEGTYINWLKNNYTWDRLKYIFITHMHPDHTGGLINFLFYKKITRIDSPIILFGPPELEEYILMCLSFQGINLNFDYKVLPVLPKIELEDSLIVKSSEMMHQLKCWSYRFNSENIDLMIATDTLPNNNTIKLANKCDILIHECTFLDENIDLAFKTKHTTLNQALKIAEKANVGRLILSHFSKRIKKEQLDSIYYKKHKCVVNNERVILDECI